MEPIEDQEENKTKGRQRENILVIYSKLGHIIDSRERCPRNVNDRDEPCKKRRDIDQLLIGKCGINLLRKSSFRRA